MYKNRESVCKDTLNLDFQSQILNPKYPFVGIGVKESYVTTSNPDVPLPGALCSTGRKETVVNVFRFVNRTGVFKSFRNCLLTRYTVRFSLHVIQCTVFI